MRRLRRLRDTARLLKEEYNVEIGYWSLKKLYYSGLIKGFRMGKTIYVYYDDVVELLVK